MKDVEITIRVHPRVFSEMIDLAHDNNIPFKSFVAKMVYLGVNAYKTVHDATSHTYPPQEDDELCACGNWKDSQDCRCESCHRKLWEEFVGSPQKADDRLDTYY